MIIIFNIYKENKEKPVRADPFYLYSILSDIQYMK